MGQLCFMTSGDLLGDFEFENYRSVYDQVRIESSYFFTSKKDCERNFFLNVEACLLEHDNHGAMIDRLQKSIPEFIQDTDEYTYDFSVNSACKP